MNLVERLAEKRDAIPYLVIPGNKYTDEARWWLNAIANELDTSEDDALEHIGQYEPDVYSGEVAAQWLRSQAQENEHD